MNAVPQPTRRPLSVDDYRLMAEAGLFRPDERVELIEGEIITMTPIGSEHAGTVAWLNRTLMRAVGDAAVMWVRSSLRLSDDSQPEPDLALLVPRSDVYRGSLPEPGDVLLLIEVAHTTLDFDRGRKSLLYAREGIAELWIVDVAGRAVERYRQPGERGYDDVDTLDQTRPVRLPTLGTEVDLRALFP